MKFTIALAMLFAGATAAAAQYGTNSIYGGSSGLYGTGSNPSSHLVNPYTTQSGTYVGGHQQTNPNNTQLDNYSTRGNVNPYTGQIGTRTPRW
jgi:hypothetical protein